MTAANPPTVRDPGNTIGVTRSIPLAVLNSLPAANKIQTSTPMLGGAPVVTQWWRLDNAFADENGNLISGWLADVISTRENPTGTRHSPWEWLNFDFIRETSTPADQFACRLDTQGQLSETELPNYQMHISTADGGPIADRLYKIIDGAGGSSCDGKLSTPEIRTALSKPWHAQSISQLISQYESEWYWQDAKWDALDPLMEHTPATPNTDWVAEKARIKTLAWWDKVEGQHGIKAGGMAWHFHVVGLVGNLHIQKQLLITKDQLTAIMLSAPEDTIDKYLLPINHTLNVFEINTPIRIAHFLSQVGHETGELKFSEELSSGTQYEDRASLGNNQPGDGPRFKGRGLLQVTGRANYSACEDYLKTLSEYSELDITSSTEKAEQLSISPELAALASGYYWAKLKPKLNTVADLDDLFWVSVYVNGWQVQETPFYPSRPKEPNNMHHRSTMLTRAKNVLGVTP
jgi:predicted chitinase